MAVYFRDVSISFGDCDALGIVYYPNYFRWMDGTFHAFLHDRDQGHTVMCRELGTLGFGLMDADRAFRSPAREGDLLRYWIEGIEWSARSFQITYRATLGDRLVLEGHERRGFFVERDGRIAAGDVGPLRDRLG